MSSIKLDCNSMSAMVSTPQLAQSCTPVSHQAYSTSTSQRSHRLEAATNGQISTSTNSHYRASSSAKPLATPIAPHVRSSERQSFSLDNQIINIDAATIHAWRHNVGQNQQDESQQVLLKLSPPASPSYKQNSTFNPSASCTVTTKTSSDFCGNFTKSAADSHPAISARVQRASLARGDSEVSKQCGSNISRGCDALGLEAKRQKDLIVTEKMIDRVHDILCTTWPSARIFDSPKSQHSGSEIEEMVGEMQLPNPAAGLPSLKCFIKEIWTRTRSSRAVLWLARKYLERLSSKILPQDTTGVPLVTLESDSPLNCSRRSFLAALMLAHKHLVDKAYTNRAWHKVSTLSAHEIQTAELELAFALDFDLRFPADEFFDEYPEQRSRCSSWLKQTTIEEEEPSFVALTKAKFFPGCASGNTSETSTDENMDDARMAATRFSASPESMLSVPMPRLGSDLNSAFSSMTGSFTFVSPAQQSNGRLFCNSAAMQVGSRIPSLVTDVSSDCSSVDNRSVDGGSRDCSRESSPSRSDGGNSVSSSKKRHSGGQVLSQDVPMSEVNSVEAVTKKRKILREHGLYLECRL